MCADISVVQYYNVLIEESESIINKAGYAFARITAENTYAWRKRCFLAVFYQINFGVGILRDSADVDGFG